MGPRQHTESAEKISARHRFVHRLSGSLILLIGLSLLLASTDYVKASSSSQLNDEVSSLIERTLEQELIAAHVLGSGTHGLEENIKSLIPEAKSRVSSPTSSPPSPPSPSPSPPPPSPPPPSPSPPPPSPSPPPPSPSPPPPSPSPPPPSPSPPPPSPSPPPPSPSPPPPSPSPPPPSPSPPPPSPSPPPPSPSPPPPPPPSPSPPPPSPPPPSPSPPPPSPRPPSPSPPPPPPPSPPPPPPIPPFPPVPPAPPTSQWLSVELVPVSQMLTLTVRDSSISSGEWHLCGTEQVIASPDGMMSTFFSPIKVCARPASGSWPLYWRSEIEGSFDLYYGHTLVAKVYFYGPRALSLFFTSTFQVLETNSAFPVEFHKICPPEIFSWVLGDYRIEVDKLYQSL